MLALMLAAGAHAYSLQTTTEGDPVRWVEFPVGHAWVDQAGDPPGAAAAASAAFEAWVGDDTPIAFEREPSPDLPPEADAPPDERHLAWIVKDWPYEDGVLAVTEVWVGDGGSIQAFDIRVNGNKPWATDGDPDAYDLQAALTHEVGHALGLDHSDVEEAAMFPDQFPGEVLHRELGDDDVAAVHALYVLAEDVPLSCSSAPGVPPAWLAGLVVLPLVRRRH